MIMTSKSLSSAEVEEHETGLGRLPKSWNEAINIVIASFDLEFQ